MVPLTTRTRPNPALSALGVLAGVLVIAISVGLLTRVTSVFGAMWAVGLLLFGLITVIAWLSLQLATPAPPGPRDETTREGEAARFYPRNNGLRAVTAFLMIGSLGAWFGLTAVVGALEESWIWLVLLLPPAVYFGGFTVLWVLGRFRPGGVWVTPTRVVDEHFGLRSEVALADIAGVGPRSETLHVTLRYEAQVTRHHLTRRPWRLKSTALDTLDIQTKDLYDGSSGLARELQRRLDTPRR